jgi:hypothetical protein
LREHNAGGIKFGDVVGFDYVPGDPRWTGVIRDPHVKDEIKTLRLSAKHPLDGIFSNFTGGLNYTQRDKSVAKNETRLIIPVDANGNNVRDIPSAAVGTPFNMAWMGVPQLIRIDVPYLVSSGALGPMASSRFAPRCRAARELGPRYGRWGARARGPRTASLTSWSTLAAIPEGLPVPCTRQLGTPTTVSMGHFAWPRRAESFIAIKCTGRPMGSRSVSTDLFTCITHDWTLGRAPGLSMIRST